MNLRELIDACIAKKTGDKQFAIFNCMGSDEHWLAMIGNPGNYVNLGEADGEFSGKGHTPEEAVAALLQTIPKRG